MKAYHIIAAAFAAIFIMGQTSAASPAPAEREKSSIKKDWTPRRGQIKKTRTELEKENPYEHERLLLTEAQILRQVGKKQEALKVLKAGLEEFPDSTNILYDYALMAENLGQYELMEDLLQRIITLDSHHQQAYNALGYSLADRNIRLDEAYTLIDKALKLAPDDPYIMDSMGWVLFRQGKLEKAEQYLRKAYAIRADNEIAVHLAEVLWVKGERQEAKALLWQVRKKDPETWRASTQVRYRYI